MSGESCSTSSRGSTWLLQQLSSIDAPQPGRRQLRLRPEDDTDTHRSVQRGAAALAVPADAHHCPASASHEQQECRCTTKRLSPLPYCLMSERDWEVTNNAQRTNNCGLTSRERLLPCNAHTCFRYHGPSHMRTPRGSSCSSLTSGLGLSRHPSVSWSNGDPGVNLQTHVWLIGPRRVARRWRGRSSGVVNGCFHLPLRYTNDAVGRPGRTCRGSRRRATEGEVAV